ASGGHQTSASTRLFETATRKRRRRLSAAGSAPPRPLAATPRASSTKLVRATRELAGAFRGVHAGVGEMEQCHGGLAVGRERRDPEGGAERCVDAFVVEERPRDET